MGGFYWFVIVPGWAYRLQVSFYVFSQFQVCFPWFQVDLIVSHGSRLVFHGSRLGFIPAERWRVKVRAPQNGPIRFVSLPHDPALRPALA